MPIKLTTAFIALILAVPSALSQSKQTVTGTITDAMCGAHHSMGNMSAAECTRACVKAGSSFALASGNKVYMLKGDKAQLDKYAGQTVKIDGTVSGASITVASIEPAK
jgi:hypothetical protein